MLLELLAPARSTIYAAVFGSRAGLFAALGDDLLERGGYARLLEAIAAPDAREVLRAGIRAAVEIYAAHRDVQRALYSIAALDDEAAGAPVRRMEADRARGMERLARGLHEQGALRPDVGVREAADLLWTLLSFDGFDLLHTGRGLPVEEVARLLTLTAERALLRADTPPG